jgi:hypothetical protein
MELGSGGVAAHVFAPRPFAGILAEMRPGDMVVVHPAASAASDADEQFNTNGVLLVGGDARAIRSRSAKDEYSDHTLVIDVDSWKAIRTALPHPPRWRVAVLNRELRLLTHVPIHPPLPPVFTFAAGS